MAKAPTDISMSEREALQRVLEMAYKCTYIDLLDKRNDTWTTATDVVTAMLIERGGWEKPDFFGRVDK